MELVLFTSTSVWLSKASLAIATAERPVGQQQRPATIWHHSPRVIGQLTGDRLFILGHFHQGRCLVLTRTDTHSGYWFAFPAPNASARTTLCGLPECPAHHRSIPRSLTSDQKLILLHMKWNARPELMEFIDLSTFPVRQRDLGR